MCQIGCVFFNLNVEICQFLVIVFEQYEVGLFCCIVKYKDVVWCLQDGVCDFWIGNKYISCIFCEVDYNGLVDFDVQYLVVGLFIGSNMDL